MVTIRSALVLRSLIFLTKACPFRNGIFAGRLVGSGYRKEFSRDFTSQLLFSFEIEDGKDW
jgi:hypothetical protein